MLIVSPIPMQVCPSHPQPFPRPGVGPEFAFLTSPPDTRVLLALRALGSPALGPPASSGNCILQLH